jgi:hypothetical protein
MRRSLAVGALAAAIVGVGASPAWAGGDGSSGGEFVPIETVVPGYYDDSVETQACGDTITVEAGDVREVEIRTVTLEDGTVVNDYRGAATLDLTRQSDGAMIDELDVSGPGHEVISPDGTQLDITLEGASLISPMPGEEAFFAAEGLFDLTYYEHGEVTLHITIDPEDGTTSALTADIDTHRLIDLCTEFDRADHHGDKGDDGHHGVKGGDDDNAEGANGDCRRHRG